MPVNTKASTKDDEQNLSGEYGRRFLPPEWVDIQDQIEDLFLEIKVKSNQFFCTNDILDKELKQLQAKKLQSIVRDMDEDVYLQEQIVG